MKLRMIGMALVLMATGFMAACDDSDEEINTQAELIVRNHTSVGVVAVGYIAGESGYGFTFPVSANDEYHYAIDAHLPPREPEYTAWAPTWTVAVSPAGGGQASTYTHQFVDQEEWVIDYTGVLGGPGGAGDLN